MTHAYIELTFSDPTKGYFDQIVVDDLVPKEKFYYSPVVSRIQGNVTHKLHFTLFFGLEASAINNAELIEFINNIQIKELQLGDLILMNGYQDMYKILCIEVKDPDKTLFNLYQQVFNFPYDKEAVPSSFKPHITLAYVQPDYEIPKDAITIIEFVLVEDIQIKI